MEWEPVKRCQYWVVSRLRAWRKLGANPGWGKTFICSTKRPKRLSVPTNHLTSVYWGTFPGWWRGRDLKLTIHLSVVRMLRMGRAILPLSHYEFIWCIRTKSLFIFIIETQIVGDSEYSSVFEMWIVVILRIYQISWWLHYCVSGCYKHTAGRLCTVVWHFIEQWWQAVSLYYSSTLFVRSGFDQGRPPCLDLLRYLVFVSLGTSLISF